MLKLLNSAVFFLLVLSEAKSQINVAKVYTIVSLTFSDSVIQDPVNHRPLIQNNLLYLDSILHENMFSSDSGIISALIPLDTIINKLNYLDTIWDFYNDKFSFMSSYNHFKYSLKYANLNNLEKLDSFIKCKDFRYLPFIYSNLDSGIVFNKFNEIADCETKWDLLGSIRILNFNQFVNISEKILTQNRDCDYVYFLILYWFKIDSSENLNNIFENEKSYFLNHIDTSTEYRKECYHQTILDEPSKYDSIRFEIEKKDEANLQEQIRINNIKRQEYLNRQDSLIALLDMSIWDQGMIDAVYSRRNDPLWQESGQDIIDVIKFEDLSPEEQKALLIKADTTLWLGINNYWSPDQADDGFRADTFSSSELIGILDTTNFHLLYDSMCTKEYGGQRTMRIHLQKIFQILGDRNAYGLFNPDSSQQSIINRWIDDYKNVCCEDSILCKKSEAGSQLMRLWKLLYPRFKSWIPGEVKCIRGLGYVYGHWDQFLTEEMIISLISDGDTALNNGDTEKVYNIGSFLQWIWEHLEVPESEKLPRRSPRTVLESQKWVDDYIYPALKRWDRQGIK